MKDDPADPNGLVEFDFERTVLADVIKTFKKVPYMDGLQVMREAYDQSYGIFDHTAQIVRERQTSDPHVKRPLASVAHHASEATGNYSPVALVVKTFGRLKIYEKFGLSLIDYLQLPREYAESIMRQAEELASEVSNITKGIQDQLDAIESKAKK